MTEDASFARVRRVFAQSPFVNDLGIALVDLGPGWVETELPILPRFMQSRGVVHGGVLATVGDNAAGAAAGTLLAEDRWVLTVEFKLNLLRSTTGTLLRCRGEVVKSGRTIVVAESRMHSVTGDESKLVATMTATLAVVEPRASSLARE